MKKATQISFVENMNSGKIQGVEWIRLQMLKLHVVTVVRTAMGYNVPLDHGIFHIRIPQEA